MKGCGQCSPSLSHLLSDSMQSVYQLLFGYYNLRQRRHDFELPAKDVKNFIPRVLYKRLPLVSLDCIHLTVFVLKWFNYLTLLSTVTGCGLSTCQNIERVSSVLIISCSQCTRNNWVDYRGPCVAEISNQMSVLAGGELKPQPLFWQCNTLRCRHITRIIIRSQPKVHLYREVDLQCWF